jgi:hypothetical protein
MSGLEKGPNTESSVFILLCWSVIDVRNMSEISMEGPHNSLYDCIPV